jgi:hypothetical protein
MKGRHDLVMEQCVAGDAIGSKRAKRTQGTGTLR